jgi:hypothetical protein
VNFYLSCLDCDCFATCFIVFQLVHLNVSDTNVSNEGVQHLHSLKHLGVLHLTGTKISNSGLKVFATSATLCKSIRELSLDSTSINDSGALYLRKLLKLRELNLAETNITDRIFEQQSLMVSICNSLEQIYKLKSLCLSGHKQRQLSALITPL